MAGTPFADVYDQLLMFIKDYRLITLYNTSEVDFSNYLSGWLIPAITEFKNCNQSLDYSDDVFTETLNQENIKILALLMKRFWLKKEVNDITQMNLHIQDKDFRTHSENANIREKKELYIQELEETSQILVDYGLNNTDWANWYLGVFYVP